MASGERATPQVEESQLTRPPLDVLAVERACLDGDDAGDVAKLPLGLAQSGPLELGDHRVLGRGDVHCRLEQPRGLPSAKLLDAERAIAADDQIDLPPGRDVDHVELRVSRERFPRRIDAHVEFTGWKPRHEAFERLMRRVDHQVDVLGGARGAVVRARERSRQHMWDTRGSKTLDDPLERSGGSHAATTGASGHAARKSAVPSVTRRIAATTLASS